MIIKKIYTFFYFNWLKYINIIFNSKFLYDEMVAPTVTSGDHYRFFDRKKCTDDDYRNIQSFPQDYDFMGNPANYVCGMSVPPNMMANIATEVYNQWLI